MLASSSNRRCQTGSQWKKTGNYAVLRLRDEARYRAPGINIKSITWESHQFGGKGTIDGNAPKSDSCKQEIHGGNEHLTNPYIHQHGNYLVLIAR